MRHSIFCITAGRLGCLPWLVLAGLLAGVLGGCQALPRPQDQALGPRLDESIRVLAAPRSTDRERAQAGAQYRDLVANHLPELLEDAAKARLVPAGKDLPGVAAPNTFATVTPVVSPRVAEPGLHRTGLGLPVIGRIDPGGANAPLAGFQVPLTLMAVPQDPPTRCCDAALVDPRQVRSVRTVHGEFAVAMDLEAPLDATRATGPGVGAGLLKLLRPGRFAGRPRVIFLQPFDPAKIPVVLVHGLMSTPRMWEPLVKALLADERIRDRYQFWFFYYPTGQPVPLSALQLRDALDAVAKTHRPTKSMILIGHSMGGILSRAQVSQITLKEAEVISPGIASWPADSTARRALVFEPRSDVRRVVFMFTPHRGSRLATSGIGAWGIRLIRLPDWLAGELAHYGHQLADIGSGRLPTSIHSLSPNSTFLRALDRERPSVPTHSVIGDRGRGDRFASSDGVVPFTSSHL
ncbi:MAG TPA: alpha/beta fold hydrolase, partial [Lamprocystis sp. (in: g-proteobacteria)]|nr:alpha/beta fold hydrolase [Lamprocystis sp. (in: g-proteobacteria)]